MFAIIQAAGHQVRVEPGQHIDLDRLGAQTGAEVTFDQVLFVSRDDGSLVAGSPVVPGGLVDRDEPQSQSLRERGAELLERSRDVWSSEAGHPAYDAVSTLLVWLEAPLPLRRERALARDREDFAPHWDAWAASEGTVLARDRTRDRADLLLDTGTGTLSAAGR